MEASAYENRGPAYAAGSAYSIDEQALAHARDAFAQADRVLVGAGAGLSAAAGLTYSGQRFVDNFTPFIREYGMTDMYSAGFYPFPGDAARWAYWAKHVQVNRFAPPALPLYRSIARGLADKDYFVITTNVDAQFQKAGIALERIFVPQGDYGFMQCQRGCHQHNYPLDDLVERMVAATGADLTIPDQLVPRCPVCGGPMVVHVRVDDAFVQDEAWEAAAERYRDFTDGIRDGNTLLLELGVGWNTPVWIRYPFERWSRQHGCALIRMNFDDASVGDLGNGSVGIRGDLAQTWPLLLND